MFSALNLEPILWRTQPCSFKLHAAFVPSSVTPPNPAGLFWATTMLTSVWCVCPLSANSITIRSQSSIHHVSLHLSAWHVPEGDFFIKTFEAMKWLRYVCFFRRCTDFLSLLLIFRSQPLWGPWTSVCCMTRRTMLCTAPLTKPRWADFHSGCSRWIQMRHFHWNDSN